MLPLTLDIHRVTFFRDRAAPDRDRTSDQVAVGLEDVTLPICPRPGDTIALRGRTLTALTVTLDADSPRIVVRCVERVEEWVTWPEETGRAGQRRAVKR